MTTTVRRVTGYLYPFGAKFVPICLPCHQRLGWFPLNEYKGTIDVSSPFDVEQDYTCDKCRRPFAGGYKEVKP